MDGLASWPRPPRIAPLLALAGILAGCHSAPLTHRRQVMLVPEAREIAWARDLYIQLLAASPVANDPTQIQLVQRVGRRLAEVAERPEFEWEFRLIASPEPAVYCLPGGKIAVCDGILPICQNEAGLAAAMAHPIGHALARHGGERLSRFYWANPVGSGVRYLSSRRAQWHRRLLLRAFALPSPDDQAIPFSARQEVEADRIALLLMARAGYDPHQAPGFWKRLSDASSPSRPARFLAVHPSYADRVAAMAEWLPEAMEVYAQVPAKRGAGAPIAAVLAGQNPGAPRTEASLAGLPAR